MDLDGHPGRPDDLVETQVGWEARDRGRGPLLRGSDRRDRVHRRRIALAAVELNGPRDLLSTGYGRILLAKVAVVSRIGLLGTVNHRQLVPRIVDGDASATVQLRRTMSAELLLSTGAIALTAVLVGLPP